MPWSGGQGGVGDPQTWPGQGSERSTPLTVTFPTPTPLTKPAFTVATPVLLLPQVEAPVRSYVLPVFHVDVNANWVEPPIATANVLARMAQLTAPLQLMHP